MASAIRLRKVSSYELISAHLEQIRRVNPLVNAAVETFSDTALEQAKDADRALARGEELGPLHGVPFSIKDSIDVRGSRTTAGTWGRRSAELANSDATVVERLRRAGAIPVAKTNLPDLLFAYESDNLIFGRTNNPYDLDRTPGGSSGGESALIAACASPLGLGSDAAGSVRVPAAFCGIASLKPTSGRLPRTGHVPPAGGWIEALWQIGPMARWAEDLALAMQLLSGEDGSDWTSPPVPLMAPDSGPLRIAFFTHNGVAQCTAEIIGAVRSCARFLSERGHEVVEVRPPSIDQAYDLEISLLGVDGGDGIDTYLASIGSTQKHPLLEAGFLGRLRSRRATSVEFAALWTRWDEYRAGITRFFQKYDAVLSPVYTQPAPRHGDSVKPGNFEGFGYTMAWNMSGNPAATVRVAEANGLPINVQVVTPRWRDHLAIEICSVLERKFGGWIMPDALFARADGEPSPRTAQTQATADLQS